jgi:hypothetical protein
MAHSKRRDSSIPTLKTAKALGLTACPEPWGT